MPQAASEWNSNLGGRGMDMPEDIAREEWFAEIHESIAAEAISGFTSGRLRSYYVQNPSIARNVFAIYREAKSAVSVSPTAALVLFTAAIEVTLKTTILKPVIYGLVHNESIADLVSDLVVKNNGLDRFKDVLSKILGQYSSLDLENYRVDGHEKTVWDEITLVQKARNAASHRADPVTEEMALLAQKVAAVIITELLQGLLNELGLELHKDGQIAAYGAM
ncbi:hypothetical protein [Rhodoferax saidenbachensis]|uniref:RiboL-PSP-HEPN domain-containing protein n=1 Tax=Rhodoferax saidenbachensis TaxID=1484693 RepID=A0ABU1ZND0_9BURK|nr:hypothetical protein [Rhodoferax saidenbachensis]MDR7307044.1 hypothetical protein [Rhodoferax saidenbachensis]